MTAAFAFAGADIMASAAGESKNSEKDLPKAVNWNVIGLVSSYMFSFFVLLEISPWQSAGLNNSPFAQVFEIIGFSKVGIIINIVVLTSALSSANACVFAQQEYYGH